MSRCFPFPPPGYEKKIRIDEADPLIKKYKEKKHKKDKEREKKEGKEKKSKDRNKDKQKEKKEKHKDRKDKEKDNEKSKALEEKKAEIPTNLGDGEKLVTKTVQNGSNGESKYVQELARRIRYEEEATGSHAQKINYSNQRSSEIIGKAFENSNFCPIQESNHMEDDEKRINTQKNYAEAKSFKSAFERGSFGADQKKAEVIGKPMENRNQVRQMESPEKIHRKESTTKIDKPRDKEGVTKTEAKDKDSRKEKKEEKTESINKIRQEKPETIGWSNLEERAKDSLDIRNCKEPDVSQASVKNLIAEGILGKRKELETNGFYENGTMPKELQRYSASVSYVKNGRTLAAERTPPKPAFEVKGTMCKPEFKEEKINGFVVSGGQQKVCPPNPLATAMKVKVKENGEAPAEPPHLDLKHLNQILNLPKRKLLEINDDQEWLFGQLGMKLKKARDSSDSGELLQVWNQAFRIESANIAALPYVVPF